MQIRAQRTQRSMERSWRHRKGAHNGASRQCPQKTFQQERKHTMCIFVKYKENVV